MTYGDECRSKLISHQFSKCGLWIPGRPQDHCTESVESVKNCLQLHPTGVVRNAPTDLLAGFEGPTSKAGERNGGKGMRDERGKGVEGIGVCKYLLSCKWVQETEKVCEPLCYHFIILHYLTVALPSVL